MVFRFKKRKKIYQEKKAKQQNYADSENSFGNIEVNSKPIRKVNLDAPNAMLTFYEQDAQGNRVEKNCPAYKLPEGIAYDPNDCNTRTLDVIPMIQKENSNPKIDSSKPKDIKPVTSDNDNDLIESEDSDDEED